MNGGQAALTAGAAQKMGGRLNPITARYRGPALLLADDACTRQHLTLPGPLAARPAALGRAESHWLRLQRPYVPALRCSPSSLAAE
ncbi:hypothetical protein NDU88_001730 [Pleurodeles waltl]|uniref:Uncharacterized protein n=1 Tax=Pleurodeles waltl TaxID=8319 RepID=A0AAV7UTK4_PLEWA|nr:hypothetical protein NDU88_001730 [Pleurodeles waltl]